MIRDAYHEAVQLGHDLLEKSNEVIMKDDNGHETDLGEGDSDDSDDDDGWKIDDNKKMRKKSKSSIALKAAEALAKVLIP